MDDDLLFLSVAEAGSALRSGAITALELTRAHLAAIERSNEALGCYLTLDADRALAKAEAATLDHILSAMPFGVKDNIDTAGVRTTAASRIFKDRVPDKSAAVVDALDETGAILLGKLNTYEFGTGTGAVYDDLAFPLARNPFDLSRFSGGSSLGAGIATSAGLAMFAIGTDTGGSVRLPAAACGVVGLKPTFGAVSRDGMQPNCPSLDHVGVIARSVDDVESVFDAIRSREVRANMRPRSGERLRIGFIRRFHEEDVPCEPEIAAALAQAVEVFRACGAEIVDISPAHGVLDHRACSRILNVSECFSVHESALTDRRSDIGAALRDKLLAGSQMSAADYIKAVRWRQILAAEINALFETCDVLLCLGTPMVAPHLSDTRRVAQFTTLSAMAVFNVSGHPALSICSGYDDAGLPLNLQLAARHGDEAGLLAAAKLYEGATGHFRRPPLARSTGSGEVEISAALDDEMSRVAQRKANDEAAARLPRILPESVLLPSTLATR